MSWSGGTYRKGNYLTNGWTGDASLGIGIEAGRHDTQDDDFANGINTCLTKDGQNTSTANLPMGGFKHTNVGNGSARNDYAALGQVQDSAPIWGGTSAGTATAYTITLTPAIATYTAGQRFLFISHVSNTGAATLNVNGVGAKNIFLQSTNALAPAGYVRINQVCEVVYDGNQFQLSQSSVELQSNLTTYLGLSTGTANAIVLTPTPALAAYNTGVSGFYSFLKDATTNTAGCTIAISGLAAITLFDREGNALKAGMLVQSRVYNIYLNGTNAYVLNPSAVFQAYTPTVTQGATVTYTNNYSKYLVEPGRVTFQAMLTATSAGTASNSILVTLPVTGLGPVSYKVIGNGTFFDASPATTYHLACMHNAAGTLAFAGDTSVGSYFGQQPAITIAAGDIISLNVVYEVV